MRLTQTLKQKPTVSPQLILANELLQLSSLELEQTIAQELAENPALEARQIRRCPECGTQMFDDVCPNCRQVEARTDQPWRDRRAAPDGGTGPPRGTDGSGDWSDPVSGVPSSMSLTEYLLHQARLGLEAEDMPIARHLIGNLDDRGWLSCDLEDAASDLGVRRERVEAVLAVVQSLEPVGIAARDARECLLIQILDLGEEGRPRPRDVARSMAERLIRDHWDSLRHSSPESLGEAVDVSPDQVRAGLRFIRENLNPFPAHAGWADAQRAPSEDRATCPQPDVIIRESRTATGGYEIDLPKAVACGLRVSASYARAIDDVSEGLSAGKGGPTTGAQGWELWQELCGRARLFVKSIEQRWETLHDLMRCLVDCQRDFLVHGERSLKPLTRAQVAETMGVHESTVSRAVAGKYVELPCGHVVPLEVFFDSAAPIKCRIEELVAQEEVPLSDRAIAERLNEQGYDVARRTVAKYRNALNILPSSLRRWSREL